MSLPERLAKIVDDFSTVAEPMRLPLLLEFSKKLPVLPEGFDSSEMEQVEECQTPFFVATNIENNIVSIYFDAPKEAPTIKGFASILFAGLDQQPTESILQVPEDFYIDMKLVEVISPMRLNGVAALVRRLKRQVAEKIAEN